jgi:hypothetical protein
MKKMALLGVAVLGLFVILTGCASSLVGVDGGVKTTDGALQGQGLYGVILRVGNSVTGTLYGNNTETWSGQDWYHVQGLVYGDKLSAQFISNGDLDFCIWINRKYSACDLKTYTSPKSLSAFVSDPDDVWIWVGAWRQSSGSYKLTVSK